MPVGQGGRDRLDGPEEARLLADETANGAGDAHEFAMQRLSAVFTGIPPRPLVYENAPKPLMGAATSKPPQITTNALDADVPIIPPIVLLLLLTCCALLAKFVHRFRFLPPYLSSRLARYTMFALMLGISLQTVFFPALEAMHTAGSGVAFTPTAGVARLACLRTRGTHSTACSSLSRCQCWPFSLTAHGSLLPSRRCSCGYPKWSFRARRHSSRANLDPRTRHTSAPRLAGSSREDAAVHAAVAPRVRGAESQRSRGRTILFLDPV